MSGYRKYSHIAGDLSDYEYELYLLYEPKYYYMFKDYPEVVALEERHKKESHELEAKYKRQEMDIEQTIENNKKNGALYTAAAALCGGLCFSSIFFLGPYCVILFFICFIVFGCLFKSTEKSTKEISRDKWQNSGLSSSRYLIEDNEMWKRHSCELRVLISQIAIDKGIIKYPADNRLGPH